MGNCWGRSFRIHPDQTSANGPPLFVPTAMEWKSMPKGRPHQPVGLSAASASSKDGSYRQYGSRRNLAFRVPEVRPSPGDEGHFPLGIFKRDDIARTAISDGGGRSNTRRRHRYGVRLIRVQPADDKVCSGHYYIDWP